MQERWSESVNAKPWKDAKGIFRHLPPNHKQEQKWHEKESDDEQEL